MPSVGGKRRLRGEWVVRLCMTLLAFAVGYVSVTRALAEAIAKADPARAHALAPGNGRVTALLARLSLARRSDQAGRLEAEQLARRALRQDPMAVPAAAVLAASAELRGDTRTGQRLLSYAERLSRRDLETQLILVEVSVANQDIAGALRHYDTALRTSRAAPDLLFPVLAAAVAEPAVRRELVRTLGRRPAWTGDFVNYVGGHGPVPAATADLLLGLQRARVPVSEGARAETINLLVAHGGPEAAWSFYAASAGITNRSRSRDAHFEAGLQAPSIFDWMPVNDGSVATALQRSAVGGSFVFSAPPTVGGPLLRQAEMLPHGDYVLQGVSADVDQSEASLPYWTLTCRADGRELGRVVVKSSITSNGRFAGQLSVPKDCTFQDLMLIARPTDRLTGVSGQIKQVQLYPAAR